MCVQVHYVYIFVKFQHEIFTKFKKKGFVRFETERTLKFGDVFPLYKNSPGSNPSTIPALQGMKIEEAPKR
jgi:hypothetical protein